jgi:peptidylprolyl isomerase
MKRIALLLALAGTFSAAQTATKPAPKPAPKPATSAAKPATSTTATHKPGTAATSVVKLPPGVTPVKGIVKSAFALKYQDFVVGTGALAEPGKLYSVQYTGWLASDGTKFDSSYDHRSPVMDKDGKPVNGDDGKPKLGDPQPLMFPQGRGRLIPGWDQGFEGMKVGGKRRLFIPYQLAYGALGRPPKIPAKSDLIFDVELVEVKDMPTQPQQGMPGGMPGRPMPPRPGGAPGTPGTPGTPTTPGTPAAPPTPQAAPAPAAPAAPATPAPAPADKPATPDTPK